MAAPTNHSSNQSVEGYENSLGIWLGARELKEPIKNDIGESLLILLLPVLLYELNDNLGYFILIKIFSYF